MELSRRTVIKSAAVVAGAAAVTSQAAVRRTGLAEAAVRGRAAAGPTSLTRTIVRGPEGAGGYTRLAFGPGAPRVLREDLGLTAAGGREACRRPVLAFAHLSDVHIIDHQSPLRVEWTDRFDDPTDVGSLGPGLFTSSHRPQEIFSAHVADSMVQAINQVGVGPVTGAPLEFAIETGDNSDNGQYNEIRWNIDVLDGEQVTPDSGSRDAYEGVMESHPQHYDPHYWHPDGTPAHPLPVIGHHPDDVARRQYGFPEVAGVLDAARRTFSATGLEMEWYSVHGNHDGLAQGNFPHTLPLTHLATGPIKVISAPVGINQDDVLRALSPGGDDSLVTLIAEMLGVGPEQLLGALASGNLNLGNLLNTVLANPTLVRLVTADADRRLLTRQQVVEEHFTTSGLPVGHGFTPANRAEGTAYYYFDKGPIRCIAMDSVNENGYSDGSLDPTQFAWLRQLIDATTDKACILFSHHTSGTMGNPLILTGASPELPRVLGDEVISYLLSRPQVIAWFNGHTHKNQIWAHARDDGSGGFWEVNTASHIDFPQQARLVEIADNTDGTLSIFTTILDHAAPAEWDGSIDTPLALASLSREVAANDWQSRTKGYEGKPEDGNVELLVQAPPGLRGSCQDPGGEEPGGQDPGGQPGAQQPGGTAPGAAGPAQRLARLRARRRKVRARIKAVRRKLARARRTGDRARADRLRNRLVKLRSRRRRLRNRIRALKGA